MNISKQHQLICCYSIAHINIIILVHNLLISYEIHCSWPICKLTIILISCFEYKQDTHDPHISPQIVKL